MDKEAFVILKEPLTGHVSTKETQKIGLKRDTDLAIKSPKADKPNHIHRASRQFSVPHPNKNRLLKNIRDLKKVSNVKDRK